MRQFTKCLSSQQWRFSFAFVLLALLAWGSLTASAAPLAQISNISHTITATSEPDSSDAEDGSAGLERPVMIGEVVTFTLSFAVPTGMTTGVSGTVNVPNGMQYLSGSASVSDNMGLGVQYSLSGGGTIGDDLVFTVNTPGAAAGTVNNTSGSSGQISISYDLLVNNIATNQDSTILTVGSSVSGDGSTTAGPSLGLIVLEPQLTITVQQRNAFSGAQITEGDAGDDVFYRMFITNNGDVPAYNINFTDAFPLDYLDLVTCCVTTGPSTGAVVTSNPSPGPFGFYWPEITAGITVSINVRWEISDNVAPLESWTNTASITYTSLPDANGSTDIVPGAAGAANGMRNGADGVGGALNDYAAEDTSETLTVPMVDVTKQIEHPSQTPVADLFGGSYSDSTDDPNTGVAEHNDTQVDLAIGEEFSYIVTVTLPEGTTYDLTMIDLASPLNQTAGRQHRVIELLSAEVIWVGGNLSGGGIEPLGTFFTLVDQDGGDGDADRFQAWLGGGRNVFNNPDGVTDDDDRYVIRITARADDEDNGQYDTVSADNHDDPNVQNRDGDIAENKVQLQWNDQVNTPGLGGFTFTQNPATNGFARNDFVEPNLVIGKVTDTATPVDAGDTVQFTITVANNGTGPAYNIDLRDEFPELNSSTPILDSSEETYALTGR